MNRNKVGHGKGPLFTHPHEKASHLRCLTEDTSRRTQQARVSARMEAKYESRGRNDMVKGSTLTLQPLHTPTTSRQLTLITRSSCFDKSEARELGCVSLAHLSARQRRIATTPLDWRGAEIQTYRTDPKFVVASRNSYTNEFLFVISYQPAFITSDYQQP